MQTEASQTIRDVENLLRDFITCTLEGTLGANWLEKSGMSPDRLKKWVQRKLDEEKKQEGGVVEPRIIYYADFYDLQTILKKNWEKFSPALGDFKTMEVFLGELEKMRDAIAHSRDLLPHQRQLATGIAGEIRTRLIRYRSKLETAEDYFPRIESVRDSLGNVWTPASRTGNNVFTESILRPGDLVDFVVTASDPLGENLDYAITISYRDLNWQSGNKFAMPILESHIGRHFCVRLLVRSRREHHARGDHDDWVDFTYSVLPRTGAQQTRKQCQS